MIPKGICVRIVLGGLLLGISLLIPKDRTGWAETGTIQAPVQPASMGGDSVVISVGQIRDLVAGYLHEHMPREPGDARIVDIKVTHPVVLPKGVITVSLKEVKGGSAMAGRIPFSVTFCSDGAHEKSTWAMAQIEIWGEAVFAKQSIKRRRPIAAEDVELRRVDLGAYPSHALVRIDEVIGSRATRNIGEGTLLTSDMVLLPPVIQKRSVVAVIAERGRLKLKTLGEAKEDGRIGDVVRVMNLQSKKVIYAKVVDSQTVRVEF